MKSSQFLLIVYQKEKFLKCMSKILNFFKRMDFLEELKHLEGLQSQLRLSKRLKSFSYESQNVSEPVIKAALNANRDKSKECRLTTKTIDELKEAFVNVRVSEWIKELRLFELHLVRPLARPIKPSNRSRSRIYHDPDGIWNHFTIVREKATR